MLNDLRKILVALQELSANCGDAYGRDGQYLSTQVYNISDKLMLLADEARRVEQGLDRLETFIRQNAS